MQRTIALIDLSPEHSYAVSVFRMFGGTDHYLSFHGPRATAHPAGLKLVSQKGGTLAGPNIPYGQKWNSAWAKANPHLMTFAFLYDVRRARTTLPWAVRWDLEKYPDVHLRLYGFSPAGEEVALSKGKPPGGGKPFELEWVIRHRKGEEPLSTQFVEVLEAYKGDPLIDEVRPLAVETNKGSAECPVAFQVIADKRTDTIIENPEGTYLRTADRMTTDAAFAVWSEEKGELKRLFLVGGSRIAKAGINFKAKKPTWTAKITSVEFAERKLKVSPSRPANLRSLWGDTHALPTSSATM